MSAQTTDKRVRVTIEVSNSFLRMLNAKLQLDSRTANAMKLENSAKLTASDVLAMLVFMEARGGQVEQIHAVTPPEWRPDIEVIHAERRVYQNGNQIAGPKPSHD